VCDVICARAGDERHEGADDRDEAAEHDSLAAVLLEECVRAVGMIAVQQTMRDPVPSLAEHARADQSSNGVVHGVSREGGECEEPEAVGVCKRRSRKRAGREEQGIAPAETASQIRSLQRRWRTESIHPRPCAVTTRADVDRCEEGSRAPDDPW
jgi:hypothetical protein